MHEFWKGVVWVWWFGRLEQIEAIDGSERQKQIRAIQTFIKNLVRPLTMKEAGTRTSLHTRVPALATVDPTPFHFVANNNLEQFTFE